MKIKLALLICLFIVIALSALGLKTNDNDGADLNEALKLAYSEAQKWDALSKPYLITSVDDYMESNTIKGIDGKRRYWNFDFVVEGTERHLIVTLHDKQIVNIIEAESLVDKKAIINTEKLILTTEEAVSIAINNYNLLPGIDWAEGYHFVLECENDIPYLTVVGLSDNGGMLRITFNANTKEIMN